jgi:prevent-host-death family protein
MRSKIQKVNAFEAKTRLSELLRETEQGASYLICRRGKEVARLIPPPAKENKKLNYKEVIASFHEIRRKISGRVKIRELVEEGRRF